MTEVIGQHVSNDGTRVGYNRENYDFFIGTEYPWDIAVGEHVKLTYDAGVLISDGNARTYTPPEGTLIWRNEAGDVTVEVSTQELFLAAADRCGVPVRVRPGDEAKVEALVAAGRRHLRAQA